ncbi:MAG: roadblock/LC7 protein [Polyangiaceae bacterium]|nr:roadblock/LC7 protein [Polyangiaceae bacterium]
MLDIAGAKWRHGNQSRWAVRIRLGVTSENKRQQMANAKETLPKLMEMDGCIGACIVDSTSGMSLGAIGGNGIDLEAAAAGNTEVVRAKRKTMRALQLQDSIEDILITLGKAYHLIRPLQSNDALFVYLVLDKSRANLAMARHQLRVIEKDLVV